MLRALWIVALVPFITVSCSTPSPTATLDAAALASKHAMTKAEFEKLRKEMSNWGRWGPDDEMGTLNFITPGKRIEAARLVTEGHSVSLSANVVKTPLQGSKPFRQTVTVDSGGAADEYCVYYHGLSITHIDALCHRFNSDGKMYNNIPMSEVTVESGGKKCSIIGLKQGLFTRAILMDIPELLGVEYLPGDRPIYPDDLDAWERRSGVRVGKGDAVLIRTGTWARRQAEGEWEVSSGSAGLHVSCMPWIREREAAIVGSDMALDVFPSHVEGYAEGLPCHDIVLVDFGMHILDNLDLEAISDAAKERQRWAFLLVVAPLAVEGGTGSPINPLGTF